MLRGGNSCGRLETGSKYQAISMTWPNPPQLGCCGQSLELDLSLLLVML